jgi:hypothetical protein
MSLKDAEMQVVSIAGAAILCGSLIVPILWFTDAAAVDGPVLKDQEVIEATIAYRKTPQKQPQKKFQNPDVEKPQGVSHDENKKPDEKKDEEKKPAKPDEKDPFGKFKRTNGDDEPVGKPTTTPDGDFNGSEKGFAPESKGDPFFGRLRGDMNFQFPEIAKAQSIPVGCIHLQPDGRIQAISFDPPIGQKGDDDLQTAAEAALRELQKTRAQNPEPVPTHLLSVTSKWLCFKFSVSAG